MTARDEDLYWLTATLVQEAGGEPAEGKLGVAWSIMNRCEKKGRRVLEIVLAPWQYSAWNTNSDTKRLLVTRQQETWDLCQVAAVAAFDASLPDPTHGSTHYLRRDVLVKLPPWFRSELVRAKLGHHEFLVPAGE